MSAEVGTGQVTLSPNLRNVVDFTVHSEAWVVVASRDGSGPHIEARFWRWVDADRYAKSMRRSMPWKSHTAVQVADFETAESPKP